MPMILFPDYVVQLYLIGENQYGYTDNQESYENILTEFIAKNPQYDGLITEQMKTIAIEMATEKQDCFLKRANEYSFIHIMGLSAINDTVKEKITYYKNYADENDGYMFDVVLKVIFG